MALRPRTLQDRFTEGIRQAASDQFDRAHALLAECVVADPGNLEYVDAFLRNLSRRARAGGATSEPPSDLTDKKSADVLRLGPERLALDPWHIPTLLKLAEACGDSGFVDVELRYLRMALEAAPNDVTANREAARLLTRLRKFDDALACWKRVEEATPDDPAATEAIASLTVLRSRQRGGLEGPSIETSVDDGSNHQWRQTDPASQPIRFDAQRAYEELRAQMPNVKRTPIQELELAIREYPSHPELYLQLAPLYMEKGRLFDAERLLQKGLAATENDIRVRQMWEDVAMLKLENDIAAARKQIEKEDNEASRRALEEANSERERMEMEILTNRCEREPDNAALRYALGMRLKQSGRLREAAVQFERALHDPRQAATAAYELGECAQQSGEIPKALQSYRLAVQSAAHAGQVETKERALFQAGSLALKLRLYRQARRYLDDLLEIDPYHREATRMVQEIHRLTG